MTFSKNSTGELMVKFEAFNSQLEEKVFPNMISTHLNMHGLDNYATKIANYSFVTSIIIVWCLSVLMSQLRFISQNFIAC